MLSCWQNISWKQPLPGSISSDHIVTGLLFNQTEQMQCRRLWCNNVDGVCRTQHTPWADGTECEPGKASSTPSVLWSWGSRSGHDFSCRFSHRCLEYTTQCVSACVILSGGKRFNFAFENYENLHYSIILIQHTERALLPQFGKHPFSHFNIPAIPTHFLV